MDEILERWLSSIDHDDCHPMRRGARGRVNAMGTVEELEQKLRYIENVHISLMEGASEAGAAFAHHSWEIGDCCDGMGFEAGLIREKITRLKRR